MPQCQHSQFIIQPDLTIYNIKQQSVTVSKTKAIGGGGGGGGGGDSKPPQMMPIPVSTTVSPESN